MEMDKLFCLSTRTMNNSLRMLYLIKCVCFYLKCIKIRLATAGELTALSRAHSWIKRKDKVGMGRGWNGGKG